MSDKYVYEELINRKKYLKDENYCPNVGTFEYGNSESVDRILKGSNVYRYDIYKYRDDDDKIKNLGGGDPISTKPYKYVKKEINKVLKGNTLSYYPHTSGDDEVKEKLIDYLRSINIKNISEDELLITSSTTHAYSLVVNSVLRKHDVVIVPIPTYGLFVYEPEKVGARVEFIDLVEKDGWKVDLNLLEKKIKNINEELKSKYKNLDYVPRVAAIYNQNPNNPLSVSLGIDDKKYLNAFAELCNKHKVLIIDDLVYMDSVYDENKLSLPIATFSKYKDNVISLFGISKSYSLAGIRAGFVVGNKYILQDMRDRIFLEMDSISMLSQVSLKAVFNNDKKNVKYRCKYLKKLKSKYKENLDIIKFFIEGYETISKKSLNRIRRKLTKEEFNYYKNGLDLVSIYHNLIPDSGFFILIDFTKLRGKRISNKVIKNDIDLIKELYKKDKIKFLPGSSFGWINNSDIIGRITFSKPWEELFNNMKSLSKIIKEIR